MKNIFVICPDLLFKTKINSTINSLNLNTDFFDGPLEIPKNTKMNQPGLIIVDLEIEKLQFSDIINLKKFYGDQLYLLGFCSHVKTTLIKNAKNSGFDKVVPRSKLVKDLPGIIKNFDKVNK